MKTNRMVFLPPARSIKEECILQTREDSQMEEQRIYERENCRKSGSQEHYQLTKEDSFGKVSLLKRVKSGEINVSPSDKGKGLAVMSTELYHEMVTSGQTLKFVVYK